MPGFTAISGHQRPKEILAGLLYNGRVPHALLFTGIEGIGKKKLAMAFAMACNCIHLPAEVDAFHRQKEYSRLNADQLPIPCAECPSCNKIKNNNHPDIYTIRANGAFIRIDQIRDLQRKLAMMPYEANMRVVLLENADTLNSAAGNALLKIIEEPPNSTLLILTTTQSSRLLPTIVSRCQNICFGPVAENLIAKRLISEGVSAQNAALIASMAGGSIAKSREMNKNDWIRRRSWVIDELEGLPSKSMVSLLALAEILARNKKKLPLTLTIMVQWYRDLAVCKLAPEKIVNADIKKRIIQASQLLPMQAILQAMEILMTALFYTESSRNIRLMLEEVLIRIAKSDLIQKEMYE